MANPHPNTSGLKPFNKLHPDEAKRIQRLGGIASARRRNRAFFIAEDIKQISEKYKKRNNYVSTHQIIINDIYKKLYSPDTPLNEKIRLQKYLDHHIEKDDKYSDEYNALQYQTAKPEYQLSGSYMDLLSGEDLEILTIQNEEEMYNAERMEKSYNEEQEYFASLNDEITTNATIDAGIPCGDTNITDTDINTDTNSDNQQ
ncbi:MAG: hypothetical protein MJ187_04200 [Alphaproteobacteria bacterium]|nr:hypothetical protein [Alphaproteobacteria bacterium]